MDCQHTPIIKAKFEPWEDARLLEVVPAHGAVNWHEIAAHFPGRNARQCRERWTNYVNPGLVKSEWTEAEDQILMQTYCEVGPKWFAIAGFLPGRSKNSVKNRYFALKRHRPFETGNRSKHPIAPHPAPPPSPNGADGTNDVLAYSNPLQSNPIFDWDVDQGEGFGFYF
jgi:hypothetical protein